MKHAYEVLSATNTLLSGRAADARRPLLVMAAVTAMLTGCTVYEVAPPPNRPVTSTAPAGTNAALAQEAVVSVYVDPPLIQPAPVLVGWAPPPLLVETPPPPPFTGAVWVGGYWVWQGNWVWAAGRWMAPPRPAYVWVNPYYEHRAGAVVFVDGFWAAPGVAFVPPPLSLHLTLAVPLAGIIPGPPPIGPMGVFLPPPPGSRAGLIVPAPLGTAPAVLTSAPPVVNVGMRVHESTTINNTRITNVTNVTNITNVTVTAPSNATASGQAFNRALPAQAHLAAALPPVVHAMAPRPGTAHPIQSFAPGHPPPVLPPAQVVHSKAAEPTRPTVPPVVREPHETAAEHVPAPEPRHETLAAEPRREVFPPPASEPRREAPAAERDIQRPAHAAPAMKAPAVRAARPTPMPRPKAPPHRPAKEQRHE